LGGITGHLKRKKRKLSELTYRGRGSYATYTFRTKAKRGGDSVINLARWCYEAELGAGMVDPKEPRLVDQDPSQTNSH
jgi:hypothetical protein